MMEPKVQYSLISGGISATVGMISILIIMYMNSIVGVAAIFEVIKWIIIIGSVAGLITFSYAYWRSRKGYDI